MNSPIIQLLVLAGIAVFLILRLKSVLGTRDGFEPPRTQSESQKDRRRGFEVIEGGPDRDITDHVEEDTDVAAALAEMKRADASFSVGEFLQGARGAYEMILMGFERGAMEDIRPFLSDEVFDTFAEVVKQREQQGLVVEADFVGIREVALEDARFDASNGSAEVSVRFIGELISVVRNGEGDIVEGKPEQSKKQKDTWTFERKMGANDPNWRLVATGE